MDKEDIAKIKEEVLPNFIIDSNNSFKYLNSKYIFPDCEVVFFDIDNANYILFYNDYLRNKDLDFVDWKLKGISIKVKRYLPLISDENDYVYSSMNDDITGYCFVCAKI